MHAKRTQMSSGYNCNFRVYHICCTNEQMHRKHSQCWNHIVDMLFVLASALHLCELVFLSDRFFTQNYGLCFVLEMDKLQLCSLASKGRGRTVNPGEKRREPKIMNQTNQRMIWTFMRKYFLSKRGEKKLWEQKKLKTLTRISHSVSSMLIFNRNSPAFWWTFFLFLLWEFNSF